MGDYHSPSGNIEYTSSVFDGDLTLGLFIVYNLKKTMVYASSSISLKNINILSYFPFKSSYRISLVESTEGPTSIINLEERLGVLSVKGDNLQSDNSIFFLQLRDIKYLMEGVII